MAGALSFAFFHCGGWPCVGVLVCVLGTVASIEEGWLIGKESRLVCGHVYIFLHLVEVTVRALVGTKEIYACSYAIADCR